jgi:hypothetical protein
MLLERVTLVSEDEARMLQDKTPFERVLNLQDPNAVMTELIRNLGYKDFKTIDANPSRWAMQGTLVKAGTDNPYNMQVFLNISGSDKVFVQVEIVHAPDKPQMLVKRNLTAIEALDLVRKLPYFPNEEQMITEN